MSMMQREMNRKNSKIPRGPPSQDISNAKCPQGERAVWGRHGEAAELYMELLKAGPEDAALQAALRSCQVQAGP